MILKYTHIIGLLLVAVVISSCTHHADARGYTLEMKVVLSSTVPYKLGSDIMVTITNKDKGYKYSELTNDSAIVTFNDLPAGFYSVNSSHEITLPDGLKTINGTSQEDVLLDVYDTLEMVLGKKGKFIIREYYYSNSLTPAGKSYNADQYIEVYNNTANTLYADGLSLVELESYAQSTNYWQSIEDDSIVVKMIWTVPGSGTDYPILPGEGFIMAKDAFNHKSDPNGNPNCPVDMGDAEFEFWSDKTPTGDIDFPAANMIEELWVYKGNDIAFHNRGGSAIALVWLPEDKQNYILNNLIAKGTPTTSSKYFCKINNNLVEDGVEAMLRENEEQYKRFDESIDAGYSYIAEGSRSGLCLRRKVKEVIEGRVVYQDTNNSTNDFYHDVVPMPKIYE